MHSCRVFALVLIAVTACSLDESPQEPVGSREEPLEIIGTIQEDLTQAYGPLDVDLLTRDFVSACYDELSTELPAVCTPPSSRGDPIDAGACAGHQCMLQVNLCVGHKYMEIADEVSEFHVSTVHRLLDGQGRLTNRTDGNVSYAIPPQSAANRTLAYRLASEAFAAAGERGVAAIRSTDCMTDMMRTAAEENIEDNRAQVFSVGYAEVVQAFIEATDKLASNRVRVAAETAQATRDFGEASVILWNAEENSIRAALAALAHADDPDEMNLELEPCTSPLDSEAVQNALSLLRQAAVREIVEDVGDEIVVEQVRDAIAADLPEIYPAGDDAATFLGRFDLTMADVTQARNYLRDEHRVFDRTMEEIQPGSGRIAGLVRPPAPKPGVATLAGTAGARALPTPNVAAVSYRMSGAMQMLDYLRWGARRALRQSESDSGLLAPALRPLFSAAATMGETETGHFRVQANAVNNSTSASRRLRVRIFGVQEGDRFEIVRSLDGLRCITTGTAEGAPCDPSEYVLDESGNLDGGVVEAQELTGTLTFEFSMRWLEEGDHVFIVRRNSPPVPFAGFDPFLVRGRNVVMFPAAGLLGQRLGELATPLPAACALPANSCAGLPADLVVPLESEITEDSDPYENSWKHYLDLADQMSAEADALGEELVRAGLELDMRGEAARDELEALCGGVVNVADVFGEAEAGGGLPEDIIGAQPDASLERCLPSDDPSSPTATFDWVTLGDRNVCAWTAESLGAPCVCPAGLEADFCSLPCPVAVPDEGGCASAFPTLPAEGYEVVESQSALRLVLDPGDPGYRDEEDPDERGGSVVNCLPIAELRWNRDLSEIREDPGYLGDELTGAERGGRIRDLQDQSWFRFGALSSLMTGSAYDEDFRDDFDITINGAAIISTRPDDLYPCAAPIDAPVMAKASDLFDPDGGIACEEGDGTRAQTRWLTRRMRRAFGTLGLISGGINGTLTRSWIAPPCDRPWPVEGSATQMTCDAAKDTVLGYWMGCGPGDQGCRCLIDGAVHDEEEAVRYGNVLCSQGIRFDQTVSIWWDEDDGFPAGHANDLWGVGQPIGSCSGRVTDEESVVDVLCAPPALGGDPADGARFRFPWGEVYNFGGCRPPEGCEDNACLCRRDPDLGIFSEPADLPAPEAGEVTEHSDAESVTHEDVYDALALGCYLELQAQGGCPFFDPRSPPAIPTVGSIGDLKKVEHFVDCAARSIAQSAGRAILPNVPRVVAEAVAAHRLMASYPAFRGQYLDALVALQTDLDQIGSLATSIQYQLQEASLATATARQSMLLNQAERELRELQATAALVARASAAIASAYFTFGASMAGLVEGYVLEQEIQAVQTEIGAIEHGQILTAYVGQIGDVLEKLSGLDSELRETYYRLSADLNRIESVQSQALSAAARAAFGDRDETGRLFPVTTVMRRRYNTLRIRYERARDRARKMAFVARRAIEQRFGLDLESLNRDLTLVEAPATWARDVCTFEGIDYQRIREAQVPNPDGRPVEELVPENYVDGYLGDYVERLRLFVESYPFDFPFQDGDDLAVVSMRDDLYRTRAECGVEVPNLLASSESIASNPGAEAAWQVVGCPEIDGVTEACLALASLPRPEADAFGANRLTDVGESLTGVLQQDVVVGVGPATLLLSWQDAFLTPGEGGIEDLGVEEAEPYRVTIERVGGGPDEIRSEVFDPVGGWRPMALSLAVQEPGTIRVTIDPSGSSEEKRGDLWLTELQLEVLDRDRALLEDEAAPSIYMPTTRSGVSVMATCPDIHGTVLRDRYFRRRCEDVCAAGVGRCGEGEQAATTACFYESTFGLDLGEIESGEIIPSAQIAIGNYNYRHERLAMNLVGTNVRDCSGSEEPATCYSNAFVPFTLVHDGEDIPIRNHDGETIDFDFERGFIEHGKALTTEAVLTNPLTGAAETLLAPYYKEELRGRPLVGHYTLRIWEDPALRWENVEDVQIVFRYRYWTRFER